MNAEMKRGRSLARFALAKAERRPNVELEELNVELEELVDSLQEEVTSLEAQVDSLRRELAKANGDLVEPHEIRAQARLIVELLQKELPDPADRRSYINSYMDSSYIREAGEKQGPGHAKAMAMAATISLATLPKPED